MEEVLLNIGSIVEVEYDGKSEAYLITGRRVIHFKTMKAWDYYSVPYPQGVKRDKEGNDDNGFYFNHPDIDRVIYKCETKIEPKNEED